MRRTLLVFITLLLFSTPFSATSFADDPPEPITPEVAYWVGRTAFHPTYRGAYCQYLHEAVYTLLPAVEAQEIDFICPYYGDAELYFESLRTRQAFEGQDSADGYWKQLQFTYYTRGQACSYLNRTFRWLMSYLKIRNLNSWVYCNGDQGYLRYEFEALVPSAPPEPPAPPGDDE